MCVAYDSRNKCRVLSETAYRGQKVLWCVVGTEVLQYHFGEFQAPDRSRGSVLGIATRLRAGRFGNRGKGRRLFSSAKTSRPALGPSSFLFNRYWGCFPGLKRPGREVNHPLPSSAEDKNEWRCTFIPTICPSWRGQEKLKCLDGLSTTP